MSAEDDHGRPSLSAITEWAGGFSWIADPDERAKRASHALSTESGVWVIDPVDSEGLDDRLGDLGPVAGVAVIQDRHTRDAEAIANRHDVNVSIPEWMELGQSKLDETAKLLTDGLPGTNYDLQKLVDAEEWEEAILFGQKTNTLVVPEAVGTTQGFTPDGQPLGIHPGLDDAPSGLDGFHPGRLLVGHGESIYDSADEHLQAALGTE